MSFNTFGKLFRFTTWGESHGPAIGCVVDGCPPNIPIKENQDNLNLQLKEKRTTKLIFYLVFLRVEQLELQFLLLFIIKI